MELTQEQIERQDFVDNTVYDFIRELTGQPSEWNIEMVGAVRDAVREVIVDELGRMTEQEFYPFLKEATE
jgi:hypothetical protein